MFQGHEERKGGPVHRYEKLDDKPFPTGERIGTGDSVCAVLVIFFDMEEIEEEYASVWNAVCFFGGWFFAV